MAGGAGPVAAAIVFRQGTVPLTAGFATEAASLPQDRATAAAVLGMYLIRYRSSGAYSAEWTENGATVRLCSLDGDPAVRAIEEYHGGVPLLRVRDARAFLIGRGLASDSQAQVSADA